MGKLAKRDSTVLTPRLNNPSKTETWAGKQTARVTQLFEQPDGVVYKKTRKINKDGSITDKIEKRYK